MIPVLLLLVGWSRHGQFSSQPVPVDTKARGRMKFPPEGSVEGIDPLPCAVVTFNS